MMTLYVTDLDGTLLTKEETVSQYTRERVNKLIGEGLNFTFATARSVGSARRATDGLSLFLPAVLYNGGLIYDFGKGMALQANLFGEEEKSFILETLRRFGAEPVVFSAREGEELVRWREDRENEGMTRYLCRRREDRRMNPVLSDEELLNDFIFYFRCAGPEERMEQAWDALKFDPRFLCIYHKETYQSDFLLEIFPREASKANAVAFLKRHLGCEKLVCFGDTSNDSDMFDVCDEKYAVMNADGWLKEKATAVIGYCEEDGVAKWLEENFSS